MKSSYVVNTVKATIEKQSERSKQVLKSLKEIEAITGQVKGEAEGIKTEVDLSKNMSEELFIISEIIQKRVSEVVKSTEQVFSASQKAHGSVEENSKALGTLDSAIQRFTVKN